MAQLSDSVEKEEGEKCNNANFIDGIFIYNREGESTLMSLAMLWCLAMGRVVQCLLTIVHSQILTVSSYYKAEKAENWVKKGSPEKKMRTV